MSKIPLFRWYALPILFWSMICLFVMPKAGSGAGSFLAYPVVDTGQHACYDNSGSIPCLSGGADFFGQDAQYAGYPSAYQDNGDGTVSDRVTGLMWVKERGDKQFWSAAMRDAKFCRIGGYDDWRAPTIKELYSLIDFRGRVVPSGSGSVPYIDTRFFDFSYGNTAAGERSIDCQDWSATEYVGTTMGGQATVFGVNFADGRIKGYPKGHEENVRDRRYIRYVRGNSDYGKNQLRSKGDGTVADAATGLFWQQQDSGKTVNWQGALAYCEGLELAGFNDWRLPNAKELQSIVDYTRSPATSGSAAIDPLFGITEVESYFWTGTTHLDGSHPGSNAVYVAFGRAMGYFAPHGSSSRQWIDVHGAGAQRSDPKTGTSADYPAGFGPQGDDRRMSNYVRCVRGAGSGAAVTGLDTAPWAGESVRYGNLVQPSGNHDNEDGLHMMRPSGAGRPKMNGQGAPKAPPYEAVQACTGNNEGSVCSFNTPRGRLKGICLQVGDTLACVPDHGQDGTGRQKRMQ